MVVHTFHTTLADQLRKRCLTPKRLASKSQQFRAKTWWGGLDWDLRCSFFKDWGIERSLKRFMFLCRIATQTFFATSSRSPNTWSSCLKKVSCFGFLSVKKQMTLELFEKTSIVFFRHSCLSIAGTPWHPASHGFRSAGWLGMFECGTLTALEGSSMSNIRVVIGC